MTPANKFNKVAPLLMAFYACLGFNIKWAKIRGGVEFQWIGYWMDMKNFRVGISEK